MGIKKLAQNGKTASEVMGLLRYVQGSRLDYARYELWGVTGFLRHLDLVKGGESVVEHIGLGDIHGGIKFGMINQPLTLRPYLQQILKDKPVYFYRLDALTTGSPVGDMSGHGLTGSITGNVQVKRTTLLKGGQDQQDFSFYFPGESGSFVNIPTNVLLNFTNKFTVEAIIRHDGATAAGSIIKRAGQMELGMNAQGQPFFTCTFTDNSSITITGESLINDGQDYHVRVHYDGTAIRLFADYGLQAETLTTKSLKVVTAPLRIGESFRGYIDEVAGFAYGLTEFQGRIHYQTAFNDDRAVIFGLDEIKAIHGSVFPDGTRVEFAMGVYVMTTPDIDVSTDTDEIQVKGYDRTIYLIDDTFAERYFIEEGDNIVSHIVSIINSAGLKAVSIQPSDQAATKNLEFFMGTTKKKAVNDLLALIGYYGITADENGVLVSEKYLEPDARPVDVEYKTNEVTVLTPRRRLKRDFFKVPNEVIAFTGTLEQPSMTSSRRNTSIKSDASIPSRRRTIRLVQQVDATTQDVLNGRAEAILAQQTQKNTEIEAETLPMPYHSHLNKIRLYDSKLKVDAGNEYEDYIETGWTMTLGGPPQNAGGMIHEWRKAETL